MIKRSEMRASCYGPGARGLPVNVRVNAHILPRTHLMHTYTQTRAHSLAYERVCDGYGDISSHVQSHNVTRNTRTHQSFSRKWNLLPSSRRISAPCTQYFARPRAAIVRRSRAHELAHLCEDDATNLPSLKGERERERRKQNFEYAATLGYSMLDKQSLFSTSDR